MYVAPVLCILKLDCWVLHHDIYAFRLQYLCFQAPIPMILHLETIGLRNMFKLPSFSLPLKGLGWLLLSFRRIHNPRSIALLKHMTLSFSTNHLEVIEIITIFATVLIIIPKLKSRVEGEDLYRKALLDALCLTHRNLAVPN